MIFIDRSIIPIPSIFSSNEVFIAGKRLDEFYIRPEESRAQERFSIPFTSKLNIEIRNSLRDLFNSKCAYCESVTGISSNGVVENFRPKHNARGVKDDFSRDSYWWLTYNWNNLYYACENCNRFKSSWFPIEGERAIVGMGYPEINEVEKPLLVDPCYDSPEKHLVFKQDGSIDYLTAKGKTTIEILKLNRSDLVWVREATLKKLFESFSELLKLWRKKKKDRDGIRKIALTWEAIFNSSVEPYLGIQRQFLSQWLSDNPELQLYLANKTYDYTVADRIVEIEETRVVKLVERIKPFERVLLKETERVLIEDNIKIDDIRHVYIDKIVLKNFRCFDNIVIQFNQSVSVDKEPWLLFLGENGVGKSSVLKAITVALCGESYIRKLQLNPRDLLKRGESSGYIHLYLKGESDFIQVTFDKERIFSSAKHPVANLVGYGAIRLMPDERNIVPEEIYPGGVKAQNLFDYSVSLANADSWLLELSATDFQVACLTLKDLMLLNENDIIVRDIESKTIFISRSGVRINIDELSDGYRSVYSLIVDIMATLVGDKVTYDVAEGVVLIDEIGTHLHPRWKMEVVSQLRRTFPRIQFIVTSHEPLCLRGLFGGEAIVLTKSIEGDIIALTDLPNPSELRIDQILTSDFFGLKSTIDPETEKIFEEYYKILALDENERTDEQQNRLLQLSEDIPKMKHLGDSLREELVYYVVDELLAKKMRSNGMKITEDLKQEAVKRVSSLWDTIEKNNGFL
jgi:uncharacterized protein (TIGR02646 family)